MKLSKANKIVNEYGAILEKFYQKKFSGGLCLAIPISTLPYSKEEIKTAIKMLLLTPTTEHLKNCLEVGYLSLATFIDDEQAQIMMNYYKWLEDVGRIVDKGEDAARVMKKGPSVSLQKLLLHDPRLKDGKKVSEIMHTIQQESHILFEEIKKFRRILQGE